MATIRGRSGVLEDVLREVRRLGLRPESEDVAGIERLRERIDADVRSRRAAEIVTVEREIAELEGLVTNGDPRDARDRTRILSEVTADLVRLDAELRRLESQTGLLRGLLNLFRIPHARDLVRCRKQWGDEQIRLIDGRAMARSDRLARLRRDATIEVERRLSPHVERAAAYRRVLDSREMIGARAESRVADELRALPREYHVLHHLRLEAQRFMRHNGKPVVSAEVDHLVVGPTGVWLIETKCWSSRFVNSGGYFDPFEQVDRAGLLCHVRLKDARLPADVRRVVVPVAALPSRSHNSWASVVPPHRVRDWIERGRPRLRSDEVQRVAAFLWDNFGIAGPSPA